MSRSITAAVLSFVAVGLLVIGCSSSAEEGTGESEDSLRNCPEQPCPINLPPPPPPRPNLRPVVIDANSGFCFGDATSLHIRIKNQGNAASGHSITRVTFSGGSVVDVATPGLAAGAFTDVIVPGPPPGCFHPDCGFTIDADATNLVFESNETDNFQYGACVG